MAAAVATAANDAAAKAASFPSKKRLIEMQIRRFLF
jgi:hypothetical protein